MALGWAFQPKGRRKESIQQAENELAVWNLVSTMEDPKKARL